MKSRLPNSVLRRIWAMSDIDGDGMLDRDEFAVAMFLIDHKLDDNDLPETLPERVVPPNKRHLVQSQRPTQSLGGRGGPSRSRERDVIDDPMYHSARGFSSRPMHDYEDDSGNGLAGYIDH